MSGTVDLLSPNMYEVSFEKTDQLVRVLQTQNPIPVVITNQSTGECFDTIITDEALPKHMASE